MILCTFTDCVVRTVYYKYGHPKECLIQNSAICPILLESMMGGEEENLTILFPSGCTLNTSKPALPILSSGATSYPVNRPVGAIYYSPVSRGKVIVFGSGHAFSEK